MRRRVGRTLAHLDGEGAVDAAAGTPRGARPRGEAPLPARPAAGGAAADVMEPSSDGTAAAHLAAHGYCVLPELLGPAALAEARAAFARLRPVILGGGARASSSGAAGRALSERIGDDSHGR